MIYEDLRAITVQPEVNILSHVIRLTVNRLAGVGRYSLDLSRAMKWLFQSIKSN